MGIVLILPAGVSLLISIFIASLSLRFQSNYYKKHNFKNNDLYIPIAALVFFGGIAIGNLYVTNFESSGQNIFEATEELYTAVAIFCASPIIGLIIGNLSVLIKSKHRI